MRRETVAFPRSVARAAIVALALGLPSPASAAGPSMQTQTFGFTGSQLLTGKQATDPLSLLQGQHGTFGNSFGFRPMPDYYNGPPPLQRYAPGFEGAIVTPVPPPAPDAHLLIVQHRPTVRGQVVILRAGRDDEVISPTVTPAPQ